MYIPSVVNIIVILPYTVILKVCSGKKINSFEILLCSILFYSILFFSILPNVMT